jgi:hypothetical protein
MDTLPTTQLKTVTDAFDYKGFPAERSKTGGWTSASMILGLTNSPLPTSLYICLVSRWIYQNHGEWHTHHDTKHRFYLFFVVIQNVKYHRNS